MKDNIPLAERFNRMSDRITTALGSFPALAGSVLIVLVWALTGPLFNFSDTWQLFINTTTTVVTFWMVFVIQNSANRDAKAVQLKLDEIIRATQGARNEMITLERAPEAVVARTAEELAAVAERAAAGETDEASIDPSQAPDRRAIRRPGTEAPPAPPDQRGTSSEA
jgi:low affinity Fe/Cu permease